MPTAYPAAHLVHVHERARLALPAPRHLHLSDLRALWRGRRAELAQRGDDAQPRRGLPVAWVPDA